MNDEIIAFIIIGAFILLLFGPLYLRKRELDKECKDVMNKTMENWKNMRKLLEKDKEDDEKKK